MVHSSVLMGEAQYLPTGYANSLLDPLAWPGGACDDAAMCKVASLEMAELEKLLMSIQAAVEGKAPETYLSS